MIDTTTNQPLTVEPHGFSGPCITVPVAQLEQVTALLDANKILYWVDEEALSMDEGPEITWINLGDDSDLALVQRVLDSIP